MKKKAVIITLVSALALLLVFAVLIVPVPSGQMKDGGTRVYSALTYKIVDWNRITADSVYEKTKVYFFPDNFRSVDSLWADEEQYLEHSFIAEIIEINSSSAVVTPVSGDGSDSLGDKVSFGISSLQDIGAKVGDIIKVTYTGWVMESYPSMVNAVKWEMSDDLRHMEFDGMWLDKTTAKKYEHSPFGDIYITRIFKDCFFARPVIPMPDEIKLNGTLSDEWCVGDKVICTYENTYYDEESNRFEADMLSIEESDFELEPGVAYKPVIYLYPEEKTEVSVKLGLSGDLICTYPSYKDGWYVTAYPDGRLQDERGMEYNYLYWEGETDAVYSLSEGFSVKGEDTAEFLEEALGKLGLTRKEANEFIVYWLPLMEKNPYNIISFSTAEYQESAELDIAPAPDTVIRVFMIYRPSDEYIEIPPQKLSSPERKGFTVVEWGGTRLY